MYSAHKFKICMPPQIHNARVNTTAHTRRCIARAGMAASSRWRGCRAGRAFNGGGGAWSLWCTVAERMGESACVRPRTQHVVPRRGVEFEPLRAPLLEEDVGARKGCWPGHRGTWAWPAARMHAVRPRATFAALQGQILTIGKVAVGGAGLHVMPSAVGVLLRLGRVSSAAIARAHASAIISLQHRVAALKRGRPTAWLLLSA